MPTGWTVTPWSGCAVTGRSSRSPDPERFAAAASLFRLREAVSSEFDRQLRPFEINRSMYLLLATLAMSPDGARRLNYLSKYLLVHPTTVTLLVDQLEKRGWRAACPTPRTGGPAWPR